MPSLVIYGNEFPGYLDNGLTPQFFKYRFLAEGDSWMDRSAMFHTSLLQKLAIEMDTTDDDVLIINIAQFGDTMRRIGDCAKDDFRQWINTQFVWQFDAILLSAGGNDFIDAARDPDPGQGLLKNLRNKPAPAAGRDCIDRAALDRLNNEYMNPSFTSLYNVLQSSRHAGTPCFLNYYDVPSARNAPAFPGGDAWLYKAYTKNGIPPHLWTDLTDGIFSELAITINGWQHGHADLHPVPTKGKLVPADSTSTEDSNDWLNEIHPNSKGWGKLARVWKDSIKQVLI